VYRLSSDQQRIVDRAGALADQRVRPHAMAVDAEGRFPRESMRALADEGFFGLTIPESDGGMGQGLRVMCAVLDEIARRCASTAMCYKMHLCGVAAYAAATNKPVAQLQAAARGEHLSTLAWSEFGSRSHFWAPVSQEQRDNGSVTLNASKSFVTSAGHADGYVVTTRWERAEKPVDSMIYLVLKDDAGLRVAGSWDALGMRGNASAPMMLRDVRIPADRALTEPGKGLDMMLHAILPVFNLGNAAISVGIAEAAVAGTQRHLTTNRFEYLDSSLADLPNERARLARMRIETDMARAHLAAAVDAVENPGPTTLLLVLEAKAAAADMAVRVTDIAMQACGGTGFTKSLGLERQFRDARAARVMGPTSDVIHDFIGRALCGMEVF
jgi:alkylation response protein AidB-like acyl-CoA dehydrogenase